MLEEVRVRQLKIVHELVKEVVEEEFDKKGYAFLPVSVTEYVSAQVTHSIFLGWKRMGWKRKKSIVEYAYVVLRDREKWIVRKMDMAVAEVFVNNSERVGKQGKKTILSPLRVMAIKDMYYYLRARTQKQQIMNNTYADDNLLFFDNEKMDADEKIEQIIENYFTNLTEKYKNEDVVNMTKGRKAHSAAPAQYSGAVNVTERNSNTHKHINQQNLLFFVDFKDEGEGGAVWK